MCSIFSSCAMIAFKHNETLTKNLEWEPRYSARYILCIHCIMYTRYQTNWYKLRNPPNNKIYIYNFETKMVFFIHIVLISLSLVIRCFAEIFFRFWISVTSPAWVTGHSSFHKFLTSSQTFLVAFNPNGVSLFVK